MTSAKFNQAQTHSHHHELRWLNALRMVSLLLSLISVGLLFFVSSVGHAENNPNIPPGARTMSNPFPNSQPGGARPYFDEEEEDPDFLDEPDLYAPPPVSGGSNSPGGYGSNYGRGGGGGGRGQNSGGSESTVSLGGQSASNGVISNNKQSSIKIDDETGSGSQEVVTDFNFPDADILEIAKTLSKLTGKNLILDKDVKGKITIISNSKISVGDAWRAFLTALDINGFALIPSGNFIRIARNRDARDKQVRTFVGDYSPDTDALITRVFQLKYISAEEVARVFRSFTPANSRIVPYEQTNTVIVTDTGSNISKLAKMLEILDVEGFDAGIEVIPVKFASATELAKLIDTLIPGTGSAPGTPGGPPRFGGGAGRFSARRTKEGGIINTIIADDRTNTLIIHANTKGTDQVRELVAKLDQKQPAQSGGGKVHVVYLQYAEAEKIATTINNLLQGQSRSSQPINPSGGGGIGINPTQSTLFEGQIKIAADVATNSLVVTASPGDFVTLQRVIAKLDIPRDQVFTEVVIMEIEMERGFDYSANVINPTNGIGSLPRPNDLFGFVQNPASVAGGVLGFKAGNEMTFKIAGQDVKINSITGLLKFIQTNTRSNVLATPQIIALDNTEATFESSEQIPYPTTTNVQGVGASQSISKEKVSLSIAVKPQINKMSNMIKLDVTAKMGDLSGRPPPKALQDISFATLERMAKTSVVVGDSDTVVLGGLMRDKKTEATTKVPVLGDIPILGWLFRAQENRSVKTNLLVFLTPTIVRQYDKMRAILDKKLKERDDFIEKHAGGVDNNRDKRDDIIRSLPNIEDLKKPPANVVSLEDPDAAAVPVEAAPLPQATGGPVQPPILPVPVNPEPSKGGT